MLKSEVTKADIRAMKLITIIKDWIEINEKALPVTLILFLFNDIGDWMIIKIEDNKAI